MKTQRYDAGVPGFFLSVIPNVLKNWKYFVQKCKSDPWYWDRHCTELFSYFGKKKSAKKVSLTFWFVSGEGFLLVFSLTDRNSFEEIYKFHKQVLKETLFCGSTSKSRIPHTPFRQLKKSIFFVVWVVKPIKNKK